MSLTRHPVVIADVSRTARTDPAGGGRPIHAGTTRAGRELRACSPYVRDWIPDAAVAASPGRVLEEHFAAAPA